MEEAIKQLVQNFHWVALLLMIAVSLLAVGKGADILVDQAVLLAKNWGMPTLLIGATIVSLGTTTPEAAVSVLAAIQGKPDLALGNAVGSVICDTGLILGIAALLRPLPLNREIVNRQGWIQVGAGFLLVLVAVPYSNLGNMFLEGEGGGGRIPQFVGFILLGLLVAYMWMSVKWAKQAGGSAIEAEVGGALTAPVNVPVTVLKLLGAIAVVIVASWILIPSVEEAALRVGVPKGVIAATLVALGTSLPELVTCVTATLKGHGELAIGNIIGADILNVLFVAGASTAVTSAGLAAPAAFFKFQFPAMLLVLVIFRVGIFFCKGTLGRGFGALLLAVYAVYIGLTAVYFGGGGHGH
jgi:cation:H+ antiporter